VYDNNFAGSEWAEFLPANHARLDNVMFAPLILNGNFVGLMGLANKPGGFTDDDVRLASAFADHASIALRNSLSLEALRRSEAQYRSLSESLEETVEEKVAELQQVQRLAAIGQMVSVVAHEIRNPLQNIRMGIDAVRKEMRGDKGKSEILDEVDYGINLLNRIVEELLEYSRPVKLQRSMWPVRNIVEQALHSLSHKLHNTNVHLELEQEDGEIFVDAPKMTRTLMNLISNAAEAMPDGGDLWICSKFSESDGAPLLSLSISDSGCGIDAEGLERIKEPFFTTKTSGTGLGIHICKKIVEAHKGSFSIKSTVNEGTTVEITLPTGNS
jgi:signal transduction histidine kinase